MKRILSLSLISSVMFFLLGESLVAQTKQVSARETHVYVDSSYGFKVQYAGTLVQKNRDEYVIQLPSTSTRSNSGGEVHIFVSQQPFVYLPGTYGGRYYFPNDGTDRTSSDRVPGDSVIVNGQSFARDYWAVYAGQGQWETVINCYVFHNGQYYVVSMLHNFLTGMPGEIVNGTRITKKQMRASLIEKLHDPANAYVSSFNQVLESFSFTK